MCRPSKIINLCNRRVSHGRQNGTTNWTEDTYIVNFPFLKENVDFVHGQFTSFKLIHQLNESLLSILKWPWHLFCLSKNQEIYWTIIHSFDHIVNQSINKPINSLINKSVKQSSVSQPASQSSSQSVHLTWKIWFLKKSINYRQSIFWVQWI